MTPYLLASCRLHLNQPQTRPRTYLFIASVKYYKLLYFLSLVTTHPRY
jgi:hypothetical protein